MKWFQNQNKSLQMVFYGVSECFTFGNLPPLFLSFCRLATCCVSRRHQAAGSRTLSWSAKQGRDSLWDHLFIVECGCSPCSMWATSKSATRPSTELHRTDKAWFTDVLPAHNCGEPHILHRVWIHISDHQPWIKGRLRVGRLMFWGWCWCRRWSTRRGKPVLDSLIH